MSLWTQRIWPLFLLPTIAVAEADHESAPLFTSDDLVEVTISGPFSTIVRQRDTENDVDGMLQYQDSDNATVSLRVGLRARGNFRNRKDICRFPPLRLDFVKDEVAATLFAGQNKLKLVTHCGTGRRYEESVIREYLAYRIFNLLSEVSFRVRLLRVTYIDTDRSKNPESIHYGFLIEHKDSLAKRTGIPATSIRKIKDNELQPAYTNITSVFHYFLSNTDFSQIRPEPDDNCCHNHALFAAVGEAYFSVPYDFDMSGFVLSPHGAPGGAKGKAAARQRSYEGWCSFNEHIPASVALFARQKDAIIGLVAGERRLRSSETKSLLRFIDRFFKIVASEKQIAKKLVKRCKAPMKKAG